MNGVGKAIAELIERVTCFGRIICSWCGKDMGKASTSQDTHGICSDCAKNM